MRKHKKMKQIKSVFIQNLKTSKRHTLTSTDSSSLIAPKEVKSHKIPKAKNNLEEINVNATYLSGIQHNRTKLLSARASPIRQDPGVSNAPNNHKQRIVVKHLIGNIKIARPALQKVAIQIDAYSTLHILTYHYFA